MWGCYIQPLKFWWIATEGEKNPIVKAKSVVANFWPEIYLLHWLKYLLRIGMPTCIHSVILLDGFLSKPSVFLVSLDIDIRSDSLKQMWTFLQVRRNKKQEPATRNKITMQSRQWQSERLGNSIYEKLSVTLQIRLWLGVCV